MVVAKLEAVEPAQVLVLALVVEFLEERPEHEATTMGLMLPAGVAMPKGLMLPTGAAMPTKHEQAQAVEPAQVLEPLRNQEQALGLLRRADQRRC